MIDAVKLFDQNARPMVFLSKMDLPPLREMIRLLTTKQKLLVDGNLRKKSFKRKFRECNVEPDSQQIQSKV